MSKGITKAMRAEVVAEALDWVGTPYHDMACRKNVGVDCAMLVFGVAKAVGLTQLEYNDMPKYSPKMHVFNKSFLIDEIIKFGCVQIDLNKAEPGDILLFEFHGTIAHAGIKVSDTEVVHAVKRPGFVVKVEIEGNVAETLRYAYRFPKAQ